MESIACRTLLSPLPLFSAAAAAARPIAAAAKPYPHKPLLSLRTSQNLSSPSQNPSSTLSSILKPAAATLAAAVALLLARLHHPLPSLASPLPPPSTQSQTLPDDTEQLLESRLASNPTDLPSLRALMELKVKSNKLPEAIAIIDRLIPLSPSETELPLLKAHLQTHSGDYPAATQSLDALLAKNPFLVEAYHGLVMAASESEGNLDGILTRVEAAMDRCRKEGRKEDVRDFKLLLAQMCVIDGKYGEALKLYKELVDEEPKDFRPYLCQGIIYSMLNKKDKAEKQFKKYQRLVPKDHPYAQYFDDNMTAIKAFSLMKQSKGKSAVKA